ncbi:nucleoside-diphosphate-sugar epimerase [Rhodotorula toruloides]|uniref:Nucleoside-diphosphate-sugar epimerase n=1 Tax=Rhodotorula toruloides TaxID=5286 RepID=A0A511KDE1_RHOTO|nr:nucleoside-diphosphate-sugar epimerase [Rhodotorula toruloides]
MPNMRLILTGATGNAGADVLREALRDSRITAVTVLSRRPLPPRINPDPSNPKLRVILHEDFATYSPALLRQLEGHSACIWALGVSSDGQTEENYRRITVDYPLAAAKAFAVLKREGEGKFVFAYVSGMGADQREGKAWAMFGRIKGDAERQLAQLPSEGNPSLATYSFRPAGILSSSPDPNAAIAANRPFIQSAARILGRFFPSMVTDAPVLARAMIEAALRGGSGSVEGWEGKGKVGNEGVFENADIKRLADESPARVQ